MPRWKYELSSYFKNGKKSKMKVTLPQYSFMSKKEHNEKTK